MNAPSDTHPTDAELQAFARGQLNGNKVARIVDHLEECPICRQRSASLPEKSHSEKTDPPSSTEVASTFSGTSSEATAQSDGTLSRIPTMAPVPAAAVPPELTGLQGFEFIRNLGHGGMGVVFLARNQLMDRLEVLKVMNRSLLGRPEAVERFLQEIRSAARLLHPNVATAFSAHSVGNVLILAMEYVDGEDLSRVVKSRGPLSISEACLCASQAAAGLQRAHELGLVHRDIKPGNLILSREGGRAVVKIVDFGLAKAKTEVPANKDLTSTNEMMGTPGYTALEQLRDAKSADIRADIYSLGCTLYYLLLGQSPFAGESAYEILFSQQMGTVNSLRQHRPDVSEELAAIINKMMAPAAQDRYQQPDEVIQALAKFIEPGSAYVPFVGARGQSAASSQPTYIPEASSPKDSKTITIPSRGAEATTRQATDIAVQPPQRTIQVANASASSSSILMLTTPRKRSGLVDFLLAGLLLAGLGLMFALAFAGRSHSATVLLSVNVAEPEVYVDGEKVDVQWDASGKEAKIAVQPGTRTVERKKDRFHPDSWQSTIHDREKKPHQFNLAPAK
jgi:serine/threonine protein kinase